MKHSSSLRAISHVFHADFYPASLLLLFGIDVNLRTFRVISEQNIDLHGISFNSDEMSSDKIKLEKKNRKVETTKIKMNL